VEVAWTAGPTRRGTVDAITADDTILFGFKAQDRNTRILDPALTTEPYGMIIAKGHPTSSGS
jgi:hypothetical protein